MRVFEGEERTSTFPEQPGHASLVSHSLPHVLPEMCSRG